MITKEEIIVLSFVILIGIALGVFLGGFLGQHATREEAIAAGVARWTVNATNGATRFEWVTK